MSNAFSITEDENSYEEDEEEESGSGDEEDFDIRDFVVADEGRGNEDEEEEGRRTVQWIQPPPGKLKKRIQRSWRKSSKRSRMFSPVYRGFSLKEFFAAMMLTET